MWIFYTIKACQYINFVKLNFTFNGFQINVHIYWCGNHNVLHTPLYSNYYVSKTSSNNNTICSVIIVVLKDTSNEV